MELKQIFELQRQFDRKLGWNSYENCDTPEDTLKFVEHFVLVMVEELGEISRVRKKYYRGNQEFRIQELRHELVDIFVYSMKARMALNMDLEKDYLDKLRQNEYRFLDRQSG
jgi:NTP pyrophosphatase (non-canonical NTP hydrolase)